jgi:hypothetical protein
MAISNTTLVLKKSGISGNTPSFLANGELAINYADGKLYYKNTLGGLSAITNSLSFSNIYANGSLLLASSPNDTLNITAANSITVLANTITKTIQIGLNESLVTSFVKKSGDTMTGDLNVSSANVYANNLIVTDALYSGLATRAFTPLPNLIAQFTGNTGTYVQVNAQNINPNGSADYVVTADVGNDTTFYIDMGLQGSQDYDSVNASALFPLDGYLYVQGNTGQLGGNLVIGTTSATPGLETRILAGGANTNNIVLRANTYGVNVVSNLTVSGVNVINFTQAAFNKANAANSLAQAAYNYANTLSGGGSGNGTTVTITNDNTSNVTGYIAFVEATSGNVSSLNVSSNNLTFNPSTGTLGVNNISINNYGNFSSNTQLLPNTSMQVIDSFPSAIYRSAFYQVQLETGADYHALQLNIINNDSSANYVTYGDVYNVTPLGNFNVGFSNNTIYVYLTPTYAQTYVTYTKNLVTKLDTNPAPTGDMGSVASPPASSVDAGYDSQSPVYTFDYGYAA